MVVDGVGTHLMAADGCWKVDTVGPVDIGESNWFGMNRTKYGGRDNLIWKGSCCITCVRKMVNQVRRE